jgi:hypothetical protein
MKAVIKQQASRDEILKTVERLERCLPPASH